MITYDDATRLFAAIKRATGRRAALVLAGSYRRGLPRLGDMDILVVSRGPAWPADAQPLDRLAMPPGAVVRPGVHGRVHRTATVRWAGVTAKLDVNAVDRANLPYALFHATGDRAENVGMRQLCVARGWALNQYGVWYRDGDGVSARRVRGSEAIKTERDLYRFLGRPYRPPAQRSHPQ